VCGGNGPMEQGWVQIGQTPFTLFGSSCCNLNDTIYLIGGQEKSFDSQSIIRISTYCLQQLKWKAKIINSGGAINRSLHASAVLGDFIFTFGGSTSFGNLGEVLTLSSTAEEVTCFSFGMKSVNLRGHTASTVGISTKFERIILFGGLTNENDTTSESLLFEPADNLENSKIAPIQTDSEAPPPRAFHSAVVSGESRQYLIVHGGRGRGGLLNDLWVLDLSPLFASPSEPVVQIDPKSKGTKNAKGISAPSLPFWSQVTLTSSLNPRCCHFSFLTTTERSFTLHTFGGIGDQGILSLQISSAEILEEGTRKFTEQTSSLQQDQETSTCRYSFTGCGIVENNNPVAIYIFGGIQNFPNQPLALPELLILDDTSTFFADASMRLQELHPKNEETSDDHICHLEYPSGDIYDGEVLKEDENTFRHGQGKLVTRDGSIYEVTFLCRSCSYLL
jgi:hypothetical protein